jgi:hypothetical protein
MTEMLMKIGVEVLRLLPKFESLYMSHDMSSQRKLPTRHLRYYDFLGIPECFLTAQNVFGGKIECSP